MSFFVLRKLFFGFLTLFVLITLTFFILRFLPGGPFDTDKVLPPEVLANLKAKYRLDLPVIKQYLFYIRDIVFKFDFGPSFKNPDQTVNEMLKQSFPISLQLGLWSLFVAFLLGVPLGLWAAYYQNTFWDRFFMIGAISGVSLPSFLTGSILILIFANIFSLLPAARWESWQHMILPALTLGSRPAAIIARLVRSAALDIMKADYIQTARAKGLSENVVLWKHVLKNSVLPVLTLSGPLVANIITGSFIVELIFAIPGMADFFVDAVFNRDYTLIMGATIIYAFFLIAANTIVDLLYTVFDPRIQLT